MAYDASDNCLRGHFDKRFNILKLRHHVYCCDQSECLYGEKFECQCKACIHCTKCCCACDSKTTCMYFHKNSLFFKVCSIGVDSRENEKLKTIKKSLIFK